MVTVRPAILTMDRTSASMIALSIASTAKKALKIRAEIKVGERLKQLKEEGKLGPGRKSVKLTDFELGENDSKRWQQMTEIPKEKVEEFLMETRPLL